MGAEPPELGPGAEPLACGAPEAGSHTGSSRAAPSTKLPPWITPLQGGDETIRVTVCFVGLAIENADPAGEARAFDSGGQKVDAKRSRRLSAEEKAKAVSRSQQVGPHNAAREFGVLPATMRNWVCLARRSVGPDADSSNQKTQQVSRESTVVSTPAPAPTPVPIPAPAGDQKPENVARVYTPSQKANALEAAAKHGISETHRKTGISRFTLYDWRRKARLAAEGKTTDSPVGGPDTDPDADRDSRILGEWRKHPGLGPSQVRNQLRRQGFKVSVFTTRRVMEENGYVAPKVKRRDAHDQDYEAIRPNQLWHMDFLHRFIHKQPVYVLFLVDDFSRYLVGASMWDGERADAVIETFEQAVGRHGRPESVMSDGGSAFYAWRGVSRFTRLLEELSCDQLIAKEPQVNGKSEVLNANVAKELFNQETFFDLAQARRRLDAWVSFYNLRRTHHALGGLLVPADRYYGRVAEVLAALESGASAEGHGEPLPVGERQLDLLKVVSHRGEIEIWCMGRRLWPAA